MRHESLTDVKNLLPSLDDAAKQEIIREIGPDHYPWYQVVEGDGLEQGDIIHDCPVFFPPSDLVIQSHSESTFNWENRDVIVLSQSCDLRASKIEDVLLCAIWKKTELMEGHLSTNKGMEDARKGNLPPFYVLNSCDLPDFQIEHSVVDFRRVYSLPLPFTRQQVIKLGKRIRLLPPYREHLAQCFARFFMRVGLPVDIPKFD